MIDNIVSNVVQEGAVWHQLPVYREVDPKGWSAVLIAAQGSWEKVVHRSQPIYDIIGSDVVQEGAV